MTIEVRPEYSINTQEQEVTRSAVRLRLQDKLARIADPIYKISKTDYENRAPFEVDTHRDVLREACVPWPITDALWGQFYPDGNVPEEEQVKKLRFEVGRFGLLLASPDAGTSVFLHLNTQDYLFKTTINPQSFSKGFPNPEVAERCKKFLSSSYNLNDPRRIKREAVIADSLLNAFDRIVPGIAKNTPVLPSRMQQPF